MESEPLFNKGLEGEHFVIKLAERSYLKYWCFPNPIDIEGDKKEICDLLLLFIDTAIIISVKNYNVNGNYERFKKRVVGKSTKQLFGAERKLFKSQREILLDHSLQGKLKFAPDTFKHIFKITISVGEDFENYEFVDTNESKGIVNIFNKETFEIIFNELDTIKDLSEYLKLREILLTQHKSTTCHCSEKDLLASFLLNAREFPKELYGNFEEHTRNLREKWQAYLSHRSVISKKLEDEKSYFLDKLVNDDVLKLENGEMLAKEFMTLSRFERRLIASDLFEIVEKYQDKKDFLARRFTKFNGIGFLFIYYPFERSQSEIDIILIKAQELYSYFHDCDQIVLLAASKGIKQWKFGLYHAKKITKETEIYLRHLASDFGWFQNETRIEKYVNEYPDQ